MKYKYILFDIDNTLIDFGASLKMAAREVIKHGGGDACDKNLEAFCKINDDGWYASNLDNIDDPDIVANYHKIYHKYIDDVVIDATKAFNLRGSFDELLNCSNCSIGEFAVLNPNVVKVLKKLSKKYTLCIASNGLTSIQPHKVVKYKEYISHIFISEDIGHSKPETQYFEYIINALRCEKTDCLMVGDSIVNDIFGANRAGIDTCFYNPSGYQNDKGIVPTYEIKDFMELLDIV